VKVPPGSWFVPPGNNRSSGRGNEAAEAFGVEGRKGDSVSMQAVTRVNAEQAPKELMWEPTRHHNGEGRRHWQNGGHTPRSDVSQWSQRGNGDGMSANGNPAQHVKPQAVEARDLQPDAREGQTGPPG
jgi:hypothetical protein